MKRILALLSAVCLFAGCIKQTPGLTFSPSEIYIKAGCTECYPITYGFEGEGISFNDIKRVGEWYDADDRLICSWDGTQYVTGYNAGDGKIGVVIFNDPQDMESGIKYSAYCIVHVSE